MTELERRVGVVREAPEHLLRALRVIDPDAELLYLGEGRWMLGQVRNDMRIHKVGQRALDANKGAAVQLERMRLTGKLYGKKLNDAYYEIRTRRLMAEARRLGFRPTAEYTFHGEPTAAIVRDQETMEWLYRHATLEETLQLASADKEAARKAARDDITDTYRAADAWRYAFTRSHAVTRHDDPHRARVASGRTRVAVAPTLS